MILERNGFMKPHKQHRAFLSGLSILLSFSMCSSTVYAAESKPLTDLNGDGVIDVFDLVLAKREIVDELKPLTLDITGGECTAGDTINVDITLKNNPGLRSMTYIINYPPEWNPIYSEDCWMEYTLPETLGEEMMTVSNITAANSILVYSSRPLDFEGDGKILGLTFKISENSRAGEYGLTFRNVNFVDKERNTISSKLIERSTIKVNLPEYEPEETKLSGIDVSHWQGEIDWHAVKESGVEFAMLRMGFGRFTKQVDPCFVKNYDGARAAGIPVGVYWYSYALTPADAVKEAKTCLQVLGGRQLEYPIAFDIEERSQIKLPPEKFTAIVATFCATIEAAGYYAMVYGSATPLNDNLTEAAKKRYDVWVANYNVPEPIYRGVYGMWQYSAEGTVNGINGPVDCNFAFRDYPGIMKNYHLNGY